MQKIDKLLSMARPPQKDEFSEFLKGLPTDILKELANGIPPYGRETVTDGRVVEIFTEYGGAHLLQELEGADG